MTAQNSFSEGGAPATPPGARARRSSPLPVRAKLPHFPTRQPAFRSMIVFLTVCTRGRKRLLANDESQERILNAWRAANFWRVGCYVIMPDHVHLFCTPNTLVPTPLNKWIEFWRNQVTRAWLKREELPIWQRDFWDRQLRRADSYSQKWEYVRNNPVRHGYVTRAEDWPYQGELNVLEWHE